MIYVYDHNTGEKFSVADLASLVEWLNDEGKNKTRIKYAV